MKVILHRTRKPHGILRIVAEKLIILPAVAVIYSFVQFDPLSLLKGVYSSESPAISPRLVTFLVIVIATAAIIVTPGRMRTQQNRCSILTACLLLLGCIYSIYSAEAAVITLAGVLGFALAKFLHWKELVPAIFISLVLYAISSLSLQFISIETVTSLTLSLLACVVAVLVRTIPSIWRFAIYIPLFSAGILLAIDFSYNLKFGGVIGFVLVFLWSLGALVGTWFFAIDREIDESGGMYEFRIRTLFPYAGCVFLLSLHGAPAVFTMSLAAISAKTRFCKQMI